MMPSSIPPSFIPYAAGPIPISINKEHIHVSSESDYFERMLSCNFQKIKSSNL